MSQRRAFTREFKVEAVSLVSRQGLSFAEAAGSFGGRGLAGVCGECPADCVGGRGSSSPNRERSTTPD